MNGNKIIVLSETKQKRAMLIMLALLVTVSVSAKVNGTMPDWMWDSKLVVTQNYWYYWTEVKSVRDLFANPNDMTDVTITTKNNMAYLKATKSKDGIEVMSLDISIKFSGNGKPMTCLVTSFEFDIPATFYHLSLHSFDPYSDESDGILGGLSAVVPQMFDMK